MYPTARLGVRLSVIGILALQLAFTTICGIVRAAPIAAVAHDGSSYDRRLPDGSDNTAARRMVAQRFFESHGDHYDFIVVFTDFPVDFGMEAIGLYTSVRNDIEGIGIPLFDASGDFGSAGRLQGVVDMGSILEKAAAPGTPEFRQSLDVLAHEIAHRHLVYARHDGGSGVSDALVGRDGAHWSFFVGSDASLMYGATWIDNGDGTFTATETRRRYSWLDLYFMGLATPEEVEPWLLIEPDPSVSYSADDIPSEGVVISGVGSTVAIEQVIAALGPRTPAAPASRDLRAGFVLLHNAAEPDPEHLAAIDELRRAFVNEYFFLTRGRAVMDTDLLEVPPAAVAENPSVDSAINYLLARQQSNGVWLDDPRTAWLDTSAATMALRRFDGTTPAVGSAQDALAAAALASPELNRDVLSIARVTDALAAAGRAPASLLASLEGAQGPDGGFGIAAGYLSDIRHTAAAAEAIWALAPNHESLPSFEAAIRSLQNSDGGFPFIPGGPSRTEATARALQVLGDVFQASPGEAEIGAAVEYLLAQRYPDGSFGDETGSPLETAAAARALLAVGGGPPDLATTTVDYLFGVQRDDGSWGALVAPTAEALVLLREALSPNLVLVAVSATDLTPHEGSLVELTATVSNTGFSASDACSVGVVNGGVELGRSDIAGLDPGESSTATVIVDTEGMPGAQELYAFVDPDDVVDESRETDNQGLVVLDVRPRPIEPDLQIVRSAIHVSPHTVTSIPTEVEISVEVRNVGRTDVPLTTLALLENGQRLDEQPASVPGASVVTIVLRTTITAGRPHAFEVVVDPDNVVVEDDETNNSATVSIVPEAAVDFLVADLIADPSEVDIGDDVTLSVVVRNAGTLTAATVVEFYVEMDGAPVRVGNTGVELDTGAFTTVSVSWRSRTVGDPVVLTAVADPQDTVSETNEANNSATGAMVVNPSTAPNLTVGDVTIDPAPALQGNVATIRARVSNNGFALTETTSLRMSLGAVDGAEIESLGVPPLEPGASELLEGSWSVDASGAVLVFATIDPDDNVTEFDENDNVAFIPVDILSLPDLELDSGDIAFSPQVPRQGESVAIQVTVRNAGEQPAESVRVAVLRESGSTIGTLLLGTLVGGEFQVGTVQWSPTGTAGDVTISAIADPDDVIVETSEDNNTGARGLRIQDSDLYADNPVFSPNGDGVKDDVTVTFRTELLEPVSVEVSHAETGVSHGSPASALPAAGSFTWSGREETGNVVKDGTYVLRFSGVGAAGPEILVTVDTDQTPIDESFADTYLLAFSSFDRVHDDPIFLSDDRHIVYESADGVFSEYETELLNLQAEQRTPQVLSTLLAYAPSPVDARVAYGISNRLYTFDLFSSQEAVVADEPAVIFQDDERGRWVAGGETVFWNVDAGDSDSLARIDLSTGALETVTPVGDVRYIGDFDVSDDGLTVVWLARTYNSKTRQYEYEPILSDGFGSVQQPLGLRVAYSMYGLKKYDLDPSGSRIVAFAPVEQVDSKCRNLLQLVDLTTSSYLVLDEVVSNARWVASSDCAPGVDPDCYWVPSCERNDTDHLEVCWSPDGEKVLYTTGRPNGTTNDPKQILLNADGSERVDITHLLPEFGGLGRESRGLRWSPRQRHLQGAKGIVGSYLNLAGRISVFKTPDGRALTVFARADDLHFDQYRIDAWLVDAPENKLVVVPPRQLPAREAIVATWSPPADGKYRLEIAATDLAGNSVSQQKTLDFHADQPRVVSRLAADLGIISPNNDGNNDQVEISYQTSEPANLLMEIASSATGEVVRSYTLAHPEAGHYSLTWHGLDDDSALVADGTYHVRLDGQSADVVVDTEPPVAALTFGELRASHRNIGYRFEQVITDTHLANDLESPLERTPRAVDEWLDVGRLGFVDMDEASDFLYRIHAEDLAGNTTTAMATPPEEALVLWKASADGAARILDAMLVYGESGRLKVYPEPALLVVRDSVYLSLDAYSIEAQSRSDLTFHYPEIISVEPETGVTIWDPTSLAPGDYDIRVAATDQAGTSFASQPLWVTRVSSRPYLYRQECADLVFADPGFPAPIADVRLRVTGEHSGSVAELEPPFIDCRFDEWITEPDLCRDFLGAVLFMDECADRMPERSVLLEATFVAEDGSEYTTPPRGFLSYVSAADAQAGYVHVKEAFPDGPSPPSRLDFDGPRTFSLDVAPFETYGSVAIPTDLPCGEYEVAAFNDVSGPQPDMEPFCDLPRFALPCGSVFVINDVAPEVLSCGDSLPVTFESSLRVAGVPGGVISAEWSLVSPAGETSALGEYVGPFANGPIDARSFAAADLAEGVWNVQASGMDVLNTRLEDQRTLIVDKTPPVVDLRLPGNNDRVCGFPRADIPNRLWVPIEGLISDANVEHWSVGYDGPKTGLVVDNHSSVLLPEAVSIDGLLAYWEVTELPSGTYTLALSALDVGRSRRCDAVDVDLDRHVGVRFGRPTALLFSTDSAGTSVPVVVEEVAIFTARILDSAGRSIRELLDSVEVTGSTFDVPWDGSDEDAQAVDDGRYTLEILVSDDCGNETTKSFELAVDSTSPEVAFVSPASGGTVAGPTDVIGTATDPNLSEYTLTAINQDTSASTVVSVDSRTVTEGSLGVWNTANLAPGVYVLRLQATDQAGNSRVAEITVTVGSATLISALTREPFAFSPNGDGVLDQTTVTVGMLSEADVVVQIRSPSVVVHEWVSGSLGPGTHTFVWDGLDTVGGPVPDGVFDIVVSASAATQSDSASVSVISDTLAPEVSIDSPAEGGFLPQPGSVFGIASDENLAQTDIALDEVVVSSLTANRSGELVRLGGLAEGPQRVRVTARDTAGNEGVAERNLIIDGTDPIPRITWPLDGQVLGNNHLGNDITGQVEEANLAQWVLEVDTGAGFVTLGAEAAAPTEPLGAWSTSRDGPATLRLVATDQAGNTGEHVVGLVSDLTPPVAALTAPLEGAYVSGPLVVIGTADDPNFATYSVEIAAPGGAPGPVGEGSAPVTDGQLASLASLPPDGEYVIRLVTTDLGDNETTASTTIHVDATAPSPPTSVSATAAADRVAVTWAPSGSTDVVGYLVSRQASDGDVVSLTPTPVDSLSLSDEGVPDGEYVYSVVAVDRAELESAPASSPSLRVDRTPPLADIVSPLDGDRVSGDVDIVVSATVVGDDDLAEWRLLVTPGGEPGAQVTSGTYAVANVPVYLLATGALDEETPVLLRLEVADDSGNVATTEARVTVDNAPPEPATLLEARVIQTNRVSLIWTNSASPDVAGYAYLRDGDYFGEPGLNAIDHLLDDRHVDGPLGDGEYTYQIVAVDTAGNRSVPSNALVAVIETGAPKAYIAEPPDSVVFEPTFVVAALIGSDHDIASITFEIAPRDTQVYVPLGAPVRVPPWQTLLDPGPLAIGGYLVRAVAVDDSGNQDPSPGAKTIFIDSLPDAPNLTALVNGDSVTLAWTPTSAPGGFRVIGSPVGPSEIVSTPPYSNTGLPEGAYPYSVTALSRYGLESTAATEDIRVYRPVLIAVDPDATPVEIRGSNATPASEVVLSEGTTQLATAIADANGSFSFSLTLSAERHDLVAVATDPAGNVSLPGQLVLFPPSDFELFHVGTAGRRVDLGWTVGVLPCAEAACGDGEDNDGDSAIDCYDADCADASTCQPCCASHEGPGCDQDAVEECVCAVRPGCCAEGSNWSNSCADVAVNTCGADCYSGPPGPCCAINGTPGCEDPAIEACVCDIRADCCVNPWLSHCVALASSSCGAACEPLPAGSCCSEQGAGCDDPIVEQCVCDELAYCCNEWWSQKCANYAVIACHASCGANPEMGCCVAHDAPGCELADVETCVCDSEPSCCTEQWTSTCVDLAASDCGVSCTESPECDMQIIRTAGADIRTIPTDLSQTSVSDIVPGSGEYVYRGEILSDGNAVAISNEVTVAIEVPPTISSPTPGGTRAVSYDLEPLVAGFATPGADVTVEQNDIVIGYPVALAASTTTASVATEGRSEDFVLSRSGRVAAVATFDWGVSEYVLRILNEGTGESLLYALGGEMPAIDPWTDRVAFAVSDALGFYHVQVFDPETDSLLELTDPTAPVSETPFGWSPGGEVVAQVFDEAAGSYSIRAFAVEEASERVLATESAEYAHAALSSDGRMVAYSACSTSRGPCDVVWLDSTTGVELGRRAITSSTFIDRDRAFSFGNRFLQYYSYGVVLLDTETGEEVFSMSGATTGIWSPLGTVLAYSRYGSNWLWDSFSREVSYLGNGSLLAFAPDGDAVLIGQDVEDAEGEYLACYRVAVDDPTVSELIPLGGLRTQEVFAWSSTGRLGLNTYSNPTTTYHVVRPVGQYEVRTNLDAGENAFTAREGGAGVPSLVAVVEHPDEVVDLALDSVVLEPAAPVAGGLTRVTANVTVVGAPSTPAIVTFASVAPDGESVFFEQSVTTTGPVTFYWPVGSPGQHRFDVVLDPSQQIQESNEENNSYQATVPVSEPESASVVVRTDRRAYLPGDRLDVAVELWSGGIEGEMITRLAIEDELGRPVASIEETTLALAAGEVVERGVSAVVPSVLAGPYQVHARLIDPQTTNLLAEDTTGIDILSVIVASANVSVDRYLYDPVGSALVETAVANTSPNAEIGAAMISTSVTGASGQPVFASDKSLGVLGLGSTTTITEEVSVASLAAGLYAVSVELRSHGVLLAAAQTEFQVRAVSYISGSIHTSPSTTPAGAPVAVEAALLAEGNVGPVAVSGRIVALGPDGVLLETNLGDLSLTVGEPADFSLTFDTASLPPGTYTVQLLANRLDELEELVAASTFRVREGIAPQLAFVNIVEGEFYQRQVSPHVQAIDDSSGVELVELSVDGSTAQPLARASGGALVGEYGTTVALPDGLHTLEAWAVDAEGNGPNALPDDANPIAVSILIDGTPPEVSVTGVEDGATYTGAVSATADFSDDNLAATRLELDGQPYANGDPIGHGDHILLASAADRAGNTSQEILRFTVILDTDPPVIAVTGVEDGAVVNVMVTPVVTITDENEFSSTITLDGVPFVSGTPVTAEGTHILRVEAEDIYGNVAEPVQISWVIDQTAPVVAVTGTENGAHYNHDVTPVITVTELHPDVESILLNGAPFVSTTVVSAEGEYTLEVTATDLAGNEATPVSISWVIDKTLPVIVVSGVEDGVYYNHDVTPVVTITDLHPTQQTIELNGTAFASGTVVSAEGEYILEATATDLAGNEASTQVSWVIDKTNPVIAVTGVEEGHRYYGSATASIEVSDAHLDYYEALLNGAPYTSGTAIKEVDDFTLEVSAVDRAGNTASLSVRFEIRPAMPPLVFALCSFNDVSIHNNATVKSYDPIVVAFGDQGHVASHGSLIVENSATLHGSAVVGSDLTVKNNARVFGDVYLAGSYTIRNNAQVDGEIIAVAPPPQPCECGYDVNAVLSDAAVFNDNALLWADTMLAPYFVDDGLDIRNNAHVSLQAGDYFLAYLTIRNNADLLLEDGALVRLFVAGDVVIKNNADINAPPSSGSQAVIVSGADATRNGIVEMENNTDSVIMLYAPLAGIALENNADLFGGIVGRDLSVRNNGQLVFEASDVAPPPLVCPDEEVLP